VRRDPFPRTRRGARDPGPLLQGLHRLREQAGFHDELHWADFDKAKLRGRDDLVELGKAAIDLVFDSDDAEFCCHIADRAAGDLTARFHRHPYPGHKAYEWLAAQVLDTAVGDTEIVAVLADRLSTSPAVRFESDVAAVVNQALRWLEGARLIRSERDGTHRRSYLLDEGGSGAAYCHPARSDRPDYFKLPYTYWQYGWHDRLSLPATSVLLIALSLDRGFVLPLDAGARWYGISRDTLRRGLRELKAEGVLTFSSRVKQAPRSPTGRTEERRYTLQGAFASRERRSQRPAHD
jgi:DNA-binding transcriptional ArsR family regulator